MKEEDNYKLVEYLNEEGRAIFDYLQKTMEAKGDNHPVYVMQLGMLAQSVYSYRKHAAICNAEGFTQKPKSGGWDQVHPAYTIMCTEWNHILKLSEKFGLTKSEMNTMMKPKKRFY